MAEPEVQNGVDIQPRSDIPCGGNEEGFNDGMNDGRKQSQTAGNEDGYNVGHGRFGSNVKRGDEGYTVLQIAGDKEMGGIAKKECEKYTRHGVYGGGGVFR